MGFLMGSHMYLIRIERLNNFKCYYGKTMVKEIEFHMVQIHTYFHIQFIAELHARGSPGMRGGQ